LRRCLRALLLAAWAALLPVALSARQAKTPELLVAKPIADLHYGDVLFQFYVGNDFEALTRLEAYQHWGRMPKHEADAELLAGGLYLSLGMHNEAGTRFEKLLTADKPVGVRNRAWFYLAKVWYARAYYDRSEAALGHIVGELTPELEAQRQHLYVNVLLREQRYDEAAARLRNWKGSAIWQAFAQFNLGVALVRQDRVGDADPVLTAVGTLNATSEEMLSLRDKANLALGFAWLTIKQPVAARVALNRVRLTGPYATRALLGVGWAEAALGDYRNALTPWLELHDRNLLDAAVQESYLAVPYAYGQLGANAQAAEYYEIAIKSFGNESINLDNTVTHLGASRMLDELLDAESRGKTGWFWQLKTLPDAPQSRYLYTLLADNDFQEGLKNYRDLASFGATLARWNEAMDAFGAMLDTRERAYAQRIPQADALLATNRANLLLGERTAVDAALTAAETGNDVAALGDKKQREQWALIRALEEALKSAAPGAETDAIADKLRLIKGALYWKLDESFKARDYAQRSTLREIDAALNEAQNRWARVQKARGTVPNNTGEFSTRIAAVSERLTALDASLKSAADRQNNYLTRLSQLELLAQKDRLNAYQVQARFALADIYDRAASKQGVEPEAAAATPAAATSGATP
jgi:hypothetical protein